ncbi:hypothetical protein GIB67_002848 [Kingdonia uniflora]|uniref:Uncharacterized protein n=1 Tax=Kingdonia uniflora TaxID=39325 RepID=A0A7J7M5C9_9MAGN|nr:hypothetical protein GIB67_002848 [Kingdonia uniflora]
MKDFTKTWVKPDDTEVQFVHPLPEYLHLNKGSPSSKPLEANAFAYPTSQITNANPIIRHNNWTNVMQRIDDNAEHWKARFIDGLPPLFAAKVRQKLKDQYDGTELLQLSSGPIRNMVDNLPNIEPHTFLLHESQLDYNRIILPTEQYHILHNKDKKTGFISCTISFMNNNTFSMKMRALAHFIKNSEHPLSPNRGLHHSWTHQRNRRTSLRKLNIQLEKQHHLAYNSYKSNGSLVVTDLTRRNNKTSPKQTAPGKNISNPLIPVSLVKTKRSIKTSDIIHHPEILAISKSELTLANWEARSKDFYSNTPPPGSSLKSINFYSNPGCLIRSTHPQPDKLWLFENGFITVLEVTCLQDLRGFLPLLYHTIASLSTILFFHGRIYLDINTIPPE